MNAIMNAASDVGMVYHKFRYDLGEGRSMTLPDQKIPLENKSVKEANNKTLADTTSQIVAANDARKDNIEQQYMNRKNQLQTQQMSIDAEKAADTANAVAGVAGTAANIAASLDSGAGKSKVARPSVASPTATDMAKLDAKVGAVPTQQQVANDLNNMIGGNAPKIKA